ncbi:hypothetical protein I6N98_00395 [Spongiibacter nanhainus]|uniref:Pyridoxamine 5'-phosphate oxidase n=1 Tax=Spongiibacter nanhainus TaxID=2794344 RepID=A0A7T4R0X4_9GAMM|nr:hypothetical protein [Spongiibacter nanhainus]QQD18373.1 hypothetical protein I6N98_00395 [Spongiibacter nanhainus]
MRINKKSQWNESQIINFLGNTISPLRLSFLNKKKEPQICSLWYLYDEGVIWAASHKNSFLIQQLKHNERVAFEISSNDYPYWGVRGKADVELVQSNAEHILEKLIARYLGNSNAELATWLMSRADDEYAIKLTPTYVNAWDFSNRMEK